MSDKSHGLVLNRADLEYTDLEKFGTVTIRYDPQQGAIVEVKGFDFKYARSCRQNGTKAMAWARDILEAAVRADRLVPGGQIVVVDTSGPELEPTASTGNFDTDLAKDPDAKDLLIRYRNSLAWGYNTGATEPRWEVTYDGEFLSFSDDYAEPVRTLGDAIRECVRKALDPEAARGT